MTFQPNADLIAVRDNLNHVGPNQLTRKPTMWGITLNQFNRFMEACRSDQNQWRVASENDPHGVKVGRYVSAYDLNQFFVQPYTQGVGRSVALMFNPEGRRCQWMVSHAWGESMDEVQETLNTFISNREDVIYFCLFANYQHDDVPGYTVNDQVQIGPFEKVIKLPNLKGMLTLHTTTVSIYTRLWCVFELAWALKAHEFVRKKNGQVLTPRVIIPAFSRASLQGVSWYDFRLPQMNVETYNAQVSNNQDKAKIRADMFDLYNYGKPENEKLTTLPQVCTQMDRTIKNWHNSMSSMDILLQYYPDEVTAFLQDQ
eukprot:TRINITY_DN811_c0_g1_i1.p1 TRINITY_DN811_c0_g1~~TRINITY_DN811_c0_g1_i1.p1  ORF type:complete len:314 (-),score=37.68 TRINITY_DN811_c0_g1_i1:77-1018(-)